MEISRDHSKKNYHLCGWWLTRGYWLVMQVCVGGPTPSSRPSQCTIPLASDSSLVFLRMLGCSTILYQVHIIYGWLLSHLHILLYLTHANRPFLPLVLYWQCCSKNQTHAGSVHWCLCIHCSRLSQLPSPSDRLFCWWFCCSKVTISHSCSLQVVV